ncbi:hypothetical protein SAMN06265222_1074 [Neorhodopirellula lusitana]|uniref:Uncharacterized protein n=1 Tax=Neorhodopirellula lusitana TaxID=445327 RepID=A0ABY1Q826_9BACT|nr:hypothetical protein SAMN06265222_1074 [Neorhodopirellula lusitana]
MFQMIFAGPNHLLEPQIRFLTDLPALGNVS